MKNIFKTKTLITILTLVAMFALSANTFFASAPSAFKDVPASHWGFTSIQRAYTDGAVSGSSYNEATGERFYSPEAKLTVAEFVTIMTRAFYADDLNASTVTGQWYAAAQDVANKHNLMKDLGSVNYNASASRYQMATIIYNILVDKGVNMPSDAELNAAQAKIGDWNKISDERFRKPIANVVAMGIITGKDANGNFIGADSVTRAEAATIYCRVADAITANGSVQKPEQPVVTPEVKPETPVTPVTPEKPVEQPKPETPATGNSGAVGTLSSTPVTLSLSTHQPVVDYWSKAPADVQAMTDKDAFNAAVQTMKDKDIEVFQPNGNIVKHNDHYNYACFEYNFSFANGGDQKVAVVQSALISMSGYGAYNIASQLNNADAKNVGVFIYAENERTRQMGAVFAPILARLNNNMSDKQKAEILIKAVTDRFDYGNGTFDWLSDNKIGDCNNYANAVNAIFGAAGIPVMNADSSDINHGWNMAYLDGKWYVVDGTCAEVGRNNGIMSISEHEEIFGYTFVEGKNNNKVAKALIEIAYQ